MDKPAKRKKSDGDLPIHAHGWRVAPGGYPLNYTVDLPENDNDVAPFSLELWYRIAPNADGSLPSHDDIPTDRPLIDCSATAK